MTKANFRQMGLIAALAIGLTMISCGGGNSNKQSDQNIEIEVQEMEEPDMDVQDIEEPEIEEPDIEAQNIEEQKQESWIYRDFKIKFRESPVTTALMGGKQETFDRMCVRVNDKLYIHSIDVNTKDEAHILFCTENGVLVSYTFNPHTKRAVRQKANFKSIEGAMRWNFEQSVCAIPKRNETLKTGCEKIAGIMCDVYQKSKDARTDEETQKGIKEAEALSNLAKALGNTDTEQFEALKKQVNNMKGTTTNWLHPAINLIMRTHVKMHFMGKNIDMDTHAVSFFQDSNIEASEIPSMNGYEIK